MNKFLSVLLISLFINPAAYAGLPPTSTQGQSDTSAKVKFQFQAPTYQMTDLGGVKALIETGNQNWLKNPGFEASPTTSGWTITKDSGTTFANSTTPTAASGLTSYQIAATAGYGHLDQSITPTWATSARNLEASCMVKASSGTGVPQICALSGGSEVQCVNVPVTSTFQEVSVPLPGPADGTTVGVRFKTTVADSTSYWLDDCYVGPNRKLASGYMASDWTAYTPTVSTGTWTNVLGWWRRVGDTMEVVIQSGPLTANGSGLYTWTLPSGYSADVSGNKSPSTSPSVLNSDGGNLTIGAPIGVATLNAQGAVWYMDGATGSVGNDARVALSDSSHVAVLGGSGATANRSNNAGSAQNYAAVSATFQLHFSVPIVGWTSSQAAYKADATPASWSATSTQAGTTTSLSETDPGSASGSIVQTTARNMTCSASGATGIACTLPRSGNYQVCMSGVVNNTTPAAITQWLLTDGSNNHLTSASPFTEHTANAYSAMTACANYNASASGSATFKVRGYVSGGTGLFAPTSWTVVELDAPMPAPYLTGSVTSQGSSGFHIESAHIAGGSSSTNCSGTPCTVYNNSSSWISSNTYAATGQYTLNFAAGTFSSAPVCTCSGFSSVPQRVACSITTPTSSSVSANCFVPGGDSACYFDIICMGPR